MCLDSVTRFGRGEREQGDSTYQRYAKPALARLIARELGTGSAAESRTLSGWRSALQIMESVRRKESS